MAVSLGLAVHRAQITFDALDYDRPATRWLPWLPSRKGSASETRPLGFYARPMPIRPQPLLVVADVQRASRWYQQVLDAASGHGGDEYDQLLVDGAMVLQLHAVEAAHHHGALADVDAPSGNGVAVWFETDDFDAVVRRSRDARAHVVTDVHVNPNAGHRELWLRDPDGYLVVFAEAT